MGEFTQATKDDLRGEYWLNNNTPALHTHTHKHKSRHTQTHTQVHKHTHPPTHRESTICFLSFVEFSKRRRPFSSQ